MWLATKSEKPRVLVKFVFGPFSPSTFEKAIFSETAIASTAGQPSYIALHCVLYLVDCCFVRSIISLEMKAFSILTWFVTLMASVNAHGRWKCPPPRDANDNSGEHITFDNTGNKYAACGPQSGNWGFGNVTTVKPGWNTITWEESISHAGSPFRIAILDEKEVARIVLLDHIPHNDASSPNNRRESTYTPYKISVNIPDVKCDKCSLQFLYVMTDKTTKCGTQTCYYNPDDAACKGSTDPAADTCAGAPNSNVCTQANECFSNCKPREFQQHR